MGLAAASAMVRAQAPEPNLPRPGSVIATQVLGDVKITAGDQTKPVKLDDRLRVGSVFTTGRRSFLELTLSNGTILRLGAESELELDEFGQQPFSSSVKINELIGEPTISRTRLRLMRGDMTGEVKRLKVDAGSSMLLSLVAGTLRITEGAFRANVRMSEIGLGICSVEVPAGYSEFEPVGGSFGRVPTGKRIGFSVEVDKVSGAVKLSELPVADSSAKKTSLPVAMPTPAPKVSEPATPSAAASEAGKAKTAPTTKDAAKAKK